ncbi:hypothetical protein [Bremerella cremea]|uniref:amino acid kinase family protein n=1 Tax=Bremerella cremea TaxID=1031537 RepID=UPI0031EA73CB
MSLSVWKLGGSCFDLPDLKQRLLRLHARGEAGQQVVVIAGGGLFADAVRRVDQLHSLPGECSHRMALDAMRMSAAMIAALLGQSGPVVDSTEQRARLLQSADDGEGESSIQVWDVIDLWHTLVPELEDRFGKLPADWRLTSDSIAAAVAAFGNAERLVLCKSIDRPSGEPGTSWAEADAVDPTLPQLVPFLKQIRWVNLRSTP